MEEEVKNARARLAEKFANNNTQIGGKGTQRRIKKKHISTSAVNEDKKLTAAIKKFGM